MNQPPPIRVLIVDDEPLALEAIQGMLESMDYKVAGKAADGQQAIEATGLLHPDVILMDIKMPRMDGIEAAHQIQQHCPTPVVLLTAYETQEYVEQAGAAGVGAYLVKPPQAQALRRAITIAMARFGDLVELRRLNTQLEDALAKVQVLSGLIPICASCKKIRDDEGYWNQLEDYISAHSEAQFSHGICPDCARKLYPKLPLPEEDEAPEVQQPS